MVARMLEDSSLKTGRENYEILICSECGRKSDPAPIQTGVSAVSCDQCGRTSHIYVRWENPLENTLALAEVARIVDRVKKGRS